MSVSIENKINDIPKKIIPAIQTRSSKIEMGNNKENNKVFYARINNETRKTISLVHAQTH